MDQKTTSNGYSQKKIQISVGEQIITVEVVSLKDSIYSVEIPGREPLFITRITDIHNTVCWVSIPHGENELAETIGRYIEQEIRF